jgi:thymidylate kinase
MKFRLQPGTVVVFEGLDGAGKSTQLELLRDALNPANGHDGTMFAHMPSGNSRFTRGIYEVLEGCKPRADLARQLAHLACHAENMLDLVGNLQGGGSLVLDRWWWSTMAYGWYAGDVSRSGLSEEVFRKLVESIWAPIEPAAVFLFLSPYLDDANNVPGLIDGYRTLADQYAGTVVEVHPSPPEETHQFVLDYLKANPGG